jgi:hypothetical protein
MSEAIECKRELIVNKSADEVWEWILDVRNIMTANQFHVAAECSESDARNPRVGLEVPILHEILGRKNHRMARIAKFEDYAISWGERLLNQDREDPFPHSEGWLVEALGPNRCRIQNHARFRFMGAVGQLIGPYVWDKFIPATLENDLQDVAYAIGAIDRKTFVNPPAAYFRLVGIREIDGKPASEVLDLSQPLFKQPS